MSFIDEEKLAKAIVDGLVKAIPEAEAALKRVVQSIPEPVKEVLIGRTITISIKIE